jgi:hypothetical protein
VISKLSPNYPLKVTNLTEHSMELRCLVSSRNASDNFDLRCLVREQMTAWVQQNHPSAFPVTRFSPIASSKLGHGLEPGEHQKLTCQ